MMQPGDKTMPAHPDEVIGMRFRLERTQFVKHPDGTPIAFIIGTRGDARPLHVMTSAPNVLARLANLGDAHPWVTFERVGKARLLDLKAVS